jgi:general secretion pathway protein I
LLPASRHKTPNARAGFTLLEALIALLVVATGIIAIGAVVAANARSVPALERHLDLISSARSIVASLPPDERLQPGTSGGEAATYRWRVDVSPMDIAPVAHSTWIPQRVRVQVRNQSGGSFSFETIRLSRRPL